MVQKKIDKKIQDAVDKIVREFRPEKVILFGSYAWGEPTEDSDVDLFIVKNSIMPRRQRQRDLRFRMYPPDLPLDLLVYTPNEIEQRLKIGDFFVRDVMENGKILYAAS
jgi:predicted nucleotidyltransferase